MKENIDDDRGDRETETRILKNCSRLSKCHLQYELPNFHNMPNTNLFL